MKKPATLVLATGNVHKAEEIRILFRDTGIRLVSLGDLNINMDVVEDGDTYVENALIKARAAASAAGMPAIADDSGIEVDALDGAPGIRSARFAGEDAADPDNNALLLNMLEQVPEQERGARFICAAVYVPESAQPGEEIVCLGEWPGRIGFAPAGESGFGYDPLFIIPEEGATAAELGPEYKREHSHRSRAFIALADHLKALS
ncbi:RdgB/HAM1 family non-canonical purine NTP pyrophosphatase [Candidatus Zixiibacteriota bacterium]